MEARTDVRGLTYRTTELDGSETKCPWCGCWNRLRSVAYCPNCHHHAHLPKEHCACFNCREIAEDRRVQRPARPTTFEEAIRIVTKLAAAATTLNRAVTAYVAPAPHRSDSSSDASLWIEVCRANASLSAALDEIERS